MDERKRRKILRDGLIEVVEYFSHITSQGQKLCERQIEQLKETRDRLYTFGEIGINWAQLANEIINEQLQTQ